MRKKPRTARAVAANLGVQKEYARRLRNALRMLLRDALRDLHQELGMAHAAVGLIYWRFSTGMPQRASMLFSLTPAAFSACFCACVVVRYMAAQNHLDIAFATCPAFTIHRAISAANLRVISDGDGS